jgi:hypothetical protein
MIALNAGKTSLRSWHFCVTAVDLAVKGLNVSSVVNHLLKYKHISVIPAVLEAKQKNV